MYEMRSSSNLSILLGIDDISDAMRFAENLQQIAVSDNQLITEMHEKQQKLESQREEINAALDELNAQQAELERDVYKRQPCWWTPQPPYMPQARRKWTSCCKRPRGMWTPLPA